jgi:hypothetical protein
VPRLRRTAAAIVALAVALVAGAASAATTNGTRVAGGYTVTAFGDTTCVPLGAVHLRCETTGLKSAYTGDLAGETMSAFEQIIDCANGRTVGQGVETFSGSLRGKRPGTLTWRIVFAANFDCTSFFPSSFRGLGVVTGGSGALAGRRGFLRFDDTSYEGTLR